MDKKLLLMCSDKNAKIMAILKDQDSDQVQEFETTIQMVQVVVNRLLKGKKAINIDTNLLEQVYKTLDKYQQILEQYVDSGMIRRLLSSNRLRRRLEQCNAALHTHLKNFVESLKQLNSAKAASPANKAQANSTGAPPSSTEVANANTKKSATTTTTTKKKTKKEKSKTGTTDANKKIKKKKKASSTTAGTNSKDKSTKKEKKKHKTKKTTAAASASSTTAAEELNKPPEIPSTAIKAGQEDSKIISSQESYPKTAYADVPKTSATASANKTTSDVDQSSLTECTDSFGSPPTSVSAGFTQSKDSDDEEEGGEEHERRKRTSSKKGRGGDDEDEDDEEEEEDDDENDGDVTPRMPVGDTPAAKTTMYEADDVFEDGQEHLLHLSENMIRDAQGKRMWTQLFGEETFFVDINVFLDALEGVLGHAITLDDRTLLIHVLDNSGTGFANMYKWSEFLKGFGPLPQIIANLRRTFFSPWFHGFLSSREATLLLEQQPIGTFLIRFSRSSSGSFALAVVNSPGNVLHILIESAQPDGFKIEEEDGEGTKIFGTLEDIIDHYSVFLKFPFNSDLPRESWFHGDVSSSESEELLADHPHGTFLIRFSSRSGCFAASYKDGEAIKHALIQAVPGGFMFAGERETYPTLKDMIAAFSHTLRHALPNAENTVVNIIRSHSNEARAKLQRGSSETPTPGHYASFNKIDQH
ncbi:Phosphatidylinositol 3-kinase regulatory subunit gamma [Balamuthia mandrillaris]